MSVRFTCCARCVFIQPAMAGYCSRHASPGLTGEQVPAFLKISLLFWSGGVIATGRLLPGYTVCKARELSEQSWPSLNGLRTDCWGPGLSLPLRIWIPLFQLAFLPDARSHVFGSFTLPLLIREKKSPRRI